MLSRQDAKNIAIELHNLLRREVKAHLRDLVDEEVDDFIGHEEAAKMLQLKPSSLYTRFDIPFTKIGGKRIYSKRTLARFLRKEL